MSTLLHSLTQKKRIAGRRDYGWQVLTAESGTGLQCFQVLYNIPEKILLHTVVGPSEFGC